MWKGASSGCHISPGAHIKNVTQEVKVQRAMCLEENSITGLSKERKGMVECGHHLQIPVSLERQKTQISIPATPLTELGNLSSLPNSPEPQFPNLKHGNNGVVVKVK